MSTSDPIPAHLHFYRGVHGSDVQNEAVSFADFYRDCVAVYQTGNVADLLEFSSLAVGHAAMQ